MMYPRSLFTLAPLARLRLPVKLAATHQPAGDVGGLQQRALGRRMGRQIAGDSDEDVPALVAVSPFTKLPNARLEHLVGMKTCILAEQRPRKGRDQPVGRVTQDKMAGDEPRRSIDLVLTIEGIEQCSADLLGRDRKVIEPVAALARQRRWRHIQITGEMERHCPVEQATHGFDGVTGIQIRRSAAIRLSAWWTAFA